MKAEFQEDCVVFTREDGDPKFTGIAHAKGEHALFYFIKKWLNARGFNLIKTRMQSDGHLMGDQYQPYLRPVKGDKDSPQIALYSGFYALRGANEDWNGGSVVLSMQKLDMESAEYFWRQIQALCHRFPDMRLADSIMPHKIYVRWGVASSQREIYKTPRDAHEYRFATASELAAFQFGVSEASGWLESDVFNEKDLAEEPETWEK